MGVPVPFQTMLTELVKKVPGATGAILADWEGEAVAQYCPDGDEYELKVIGAHKGIILNRMRELHASLGAGELRETVITTAEQHILVGAVGPEYVLVMTLERTALLGQALFHFRSCITPLEKEIY